MTCAQLSLLDRMIAVFAAESNITVDETKERLKKSLLGPETERITCDRELQQKLALVVESACPQLTDKYMTNQMVIDFFKGNLALVCDNGAESLVTFLLDDIGVSVDDEVNKTFPLNVAASGDAVEIMRILLAHGARFDQRSSLGGDQPIHSAAMHGSARALQLLIDIGADPMAKNADGSTPWDLASSKNRPWWARECPGHGLAMEALFKVMGVPKADEWDKLTIAVRCGRAEVVAEALAADPALTGDARLLEVAFEYKQEAVARILIDAGVGVSDRALGCARGSAVLALALRSIYRAKSEFPPSNTALLLKAIDSFDFDSVVQLLAAGCMPTIDAAIHASKREQYKTMVALLAGGLVVCDWSPILSTLGSMMEFKEMPAEGEQAAYARQTKMWREITDDATALADAERLIDAARLAMIRPRLLDICTALHALELDALCMTTILLATVNVAKNLAFHQVWNLVTAAKHFHDAKKN